MSFIGFAILVLTILVITKTVDVENILQPSLLVDVLVVIGVLDILAGILLLRLK